MFLIKYLTGEEQNENRDIVTYSQLPITTLNEITIELLVTIGELHKKDELLAAALRYPILWDGHLARPCIISGQDARTTRNFGYFFNWKSLGILNYF
jgi:hypothetical protein